MHKKIADLFGSFVKSAYICIINKGDKLTSSPLSKFEIVFSSLYKFCEGMFRRETVHSHFFVPPSPFRFSVPVSCCPFGGGSLFLVRRSSAEGLANGADTHTLPKTSGLRVR